MGYLMELVKARRRILELETRIAELEGQAEVKPPWVQQSREEVAEAHIEAAGIHYSVMVALEEGTATPENWGSYEWNEYWWKKHLEGAWYESPEYCKERGIV